MLAHPAASQDPPVPGAVLGSAERSERQLALGRRTARIRRIDGLCVPAEVRENPLDRCGRLDAGNHTKAAAAQRRHVSISMANTRLRRCAHVRARCRSVTEASPHSPATAARVLGTTRARAGLAGTNTPW